MLFFIFFCGLLTGSHAMQDSQIEQLKSRLADKTADDSSRFVWNNSLFGLFLNVNLDSAQYYGEQAQIIAERLEKQKFLASNILNFGSYYWYRSDFTTAMDHYTRAAGIFEKLGNPLDVADARINIATMYLILEDMQKAKSYFKEVLGIYQEHERFLGITNAYNSLGIIYDSENKYDSAIYCFEKCIEAAKAGNALVQEAWGVSGLGEMYRKNGDYEKALFYELKSLNIEKQLGNQRGILQSYIQLAALEKVKKNYKAAASYLDRALEMPVLQGDLLNQAKLYQEYVDLLELQGELEKAFFYHKKLFVVNDSLRNTEDRALMSELSEKYESERKENEILNLQKDKQLAGLTLEKEKNQKLIFVGASFFFLVLAALMIFGYAQIKKSRNALNITNQEITIINQELNESQAALTISNQTKDQLFAMIAHDLRGPVSSLQGIGRMLDYYTSKGDKVELSQLTSQIDQSVGAVNHLLDNLLKWALTQTEGIKYQPTVFTLKQLLTDCKTIFEEAATIKQINVDLMIHDNLLVKGDYNMVSSILRNLLSNAIKFSPIGSKVEIAALSENGHIKVSVKDSGSGMPAATIEQIQNEETITSTPGTLGEKGTGLGLILTREFVANHGSSLQIAASSAGTEISFGLPAAS